MAKRKQIGEQSLALVEDYATALDAVTSAAGANTTAALRKSLTGIQGDLRRFYGKFLDEAIPSDLNAQGQPRRPLEYSIKQFTVRYGELTKIAKGFLPEAELAALQKSYQGDFKQAIGIGGKLQAKLVRLVDPKTAAPFAGPDPLVIKAGAERTSAFIRGEAQVFRDNLTQITLDGLASGRGYKAIERDIRTLLVGADGPNALTRRMGLERRAELIARSELANAAVQAQKDYAQAGGYRYVRWIATLDERTCPVCGSRHGRVFKTSEVTGTAHPRCRCVLSAVPNEAAEEQDPELRAQLLDDAFWAEQRKDMAGELAKANGWDPSQVEAKIQANLLKPTASERRLYPDIQKSAQPVTGPGKGGPPAPPAPRAPKAPRPPTAPAAPSAKADSKPSGKDGIGPSAPFMTKGKSTPTTPPETWDRKTLADISSMARGLDAKETAAFRKQVANYTDAGMARFMEGEAMQLDYFLGRDPFAKDGRSWQIGFERAYGPKLTPEGLSKWLEKADPKVKADTALNPRARDKRNPFDAKAIDKLLAGLEESGGNLAASRAMAKMMREEDLLIAWGKRGTKNWDELLTDPRAKEWTNKISGPLIPRTANGHTAHAARVVGMTYADEGKILSDAANLNAQALKDVIDDGLDRMLKRKAAGGAQTEIWSASQLSKEAMDNGYVRRKADGFLDQVKPSEELTATLTANKTVTTLIHEMGHQMQWYLDQRSIPGGVRTYESRYAGNLRRVSLPGTDQRHGSKYSQTNSQEQFAEDWVFYLVSPDKFRELKPKSAQFLDRLIQSVFELDNPVA